MCVSLMTRRYQVYWSDGRLRISLPPLTARGPEKELVPVRIHVPLPSLTTPVLIVAFVPSSFWDRIVGFFRFRTYVAGVKVRTEGDRIFINVAVVVKYGVSIKAVVDALKTSIKYRVEKFTGMIVDTMNVKVMGVER